MSRAAPPNSAPPPLRARLPRMPARTRPGDRSWIASCTRVSRLAGGRKISDAEQEEKAAWWAQLQEQHGLERARVLAAELAAIEVEHWLWQEEE